MSTSAHPATPASPVTPREPATARRDLPRTLHTTGLSGQRILMERLAPQLPDSRRLSPAPQNDRFSMATRVSGRSGRARGSNVGASTESGESGLGDKSVWWRWQAPISGRLTVDTTGSNFDTILGVYTGTRISSLDRCRERRYQRSAEPCDAGRDCGNDLSVPDR